MTMSNDPTTTPGAGKTGRGRPASRVSYPEMMGDGTEEQNLNQTGDPSARITEAEVDQAFAARHESRTFLDADKARQAADKLADKARDTADETLSSLTGTVNAVRDQVQQSAEQARDWAKKQAGSAAESAKQLHAERPVLVLSVSAGAALAVGLLAGFVIGRATADDY
jgi:ElaB/YqjD/DUF883 family membrane-anchored ribosome-binding protein